jgi:tetrahydromethanopterin S-methyltransferase subunit A
VSREEIEAFRRQVEVVDMVGCEDEEKIVEKIKELSRKVNSSRSCEQSGEIRKPVRISGAPTIQAKEPARVKMDKAGYFVILPQPEKETIVVEYYAYDNTLRRIIEGKDARGIYRTVIENGWVTQLSHAAYLGKECHN